MTEYERQLLRMLVRAKKAQTAEEREEHFRTAEEWSTRARQAGHGSVKRDDLPDDEA